VSYSVLVFRASTNDKGAYIPNVYIDEFAIAQNRVAWVDADVNRKLVGDGIKLDQYTQLVVGAIRADRGLNASVAPQGGMIDLKALGFAQPRQGRRDHRIPESA
jgi:hypothetical protein